ncbi:hypothetical protein FRC12_005765 [Ceratobasidium sp. 428]|nr:hypothetical protein FRC12_005765 [Ceratobasidium sp. 428]
MPPRPHASGRPRCDSCIARRNTRCSRDLPKCTACASNDRECVYTVNGQALPPPPPPSSSLSDAPPLHPVPAGIRHPRDTPTALFDDGDSNQGPARPNQDAARLDDNGDAHDRRKRALASPEPNDPTQRRQYLRLLEEQAERIREELRMGEAINNPEDNAGGRSQARSRVAGERGMATYGLDRGIEGGSRADKGKNRDRRGSSSDSSDKSNDTVVPGYTASGMQLPIAETVIATMRKGWSKHIALTMLDDEYCEKVARGHVSTQSVGFNDKGSVHIVETDVKDPSRDEHAMSFAQWDQAVPRLLSLIKQHLRERDFIRWRSYFELIRAQPTFHAEWNLWLAYDIQMRMITRWNKKLDFTVLNQAVLDDLRPRYQAKRIQTELINSGLRIAQNFPSSSRPRHDRYPSYSETSSLPRWNDTRSNEPRPQDSRPYEPRSYDSRSYDRRRLRNPNNAGPSGKCFRCGERGHYAARCNASAQVSGKPILIRAKGNDWTLDGNPFCYKHNGISGPCLTSSCEHKHICSLCRGTDHGAQSCPQ